MFTFFFPVTQMAIMAPGLYACKAVWAHCKYIILDMGLKCQEQIVEVHNELWNIYIQLISRPTGRKVHFWKCYVPVSVSAEILHLTTVLHTSFCYSLNSFHIQFISISNNTKLIETCVL